jgi:hypothetical protein
VHHRYQRHRWQFGVNDTGGKFATGFASVVDTGGKFATGVNDTGGKFATGIRGLGKLIHEKNQKQKIS